MASQSTQKIVLFTPDESRLKDHPSASSSYHCYTLPKDPPPTSENTTLSDYSIGIQEIFYTPTTTLPKSNSKSKKNMSEDELAIWQSLKACGRNKRQLENIFGFLSDRSSLLPAVGDNALFTRHMKGNELVLRSYTDVNFSSSDHRIAGNGCYREYIHPRTFKFNPNKQDIYNYDGPIRILSGVCLWNRNILQKYQSSPDHWNTLSAQPATLYEVDRIMMFSRFIAEIVCMLPEDVTVQVELDIPCAQYVACNPYLQDCDDEEFKRLVPRWMRIVEKRHEQVYCAFRDCIEGFIRLKGVELSGRGNISIRRTEGLKEVLRYSDKRIDSNGMMSNLREHKVGWTELVEGLNLQTPEAVMDVMGLGYAYEILRPLLEYRAKSKQNLNHCFDSDVVEEVGRASFEIPSRPQSQLSISNSSSQSSSSSSPWSTPSACSSSSNISSTTSTSTDDENNHENKFLTILVDHISEWKICNKAQMYLKNTSKPGRQEEEEEEEGSISVIACYLSEKVFVSQHQEMEKAKGNSTLYEFDLDDKKKIWEVLEVVHGGDAVKEVMGILRRHEL